MKPIKNLTLIVIFFSSLKVLPRGAAQGLRGQRLPPGGLQESCGGLQESDRAEEAARRERRQGRGQEGPQQSAEAAAAA